MALEQVENNAEQMKQMMSYISHKVITRKDVKIDDRYPRWC